jgi:hypothetical protein
VEGEGLSTAWTSALGATQAKQVLIFIFIFLFIQLWTLVSPSNPIKNLTPPKITSAIPKFREKRNLQALFSFNLIHLQYT